MNKFKVFLFYFLSYTWGILMSLIGFIVTIVLYCRGYKAKRFGLCWYFPIATGYGISIGQCIIADKNETKSLLYHEHGHAFQNIIFGPFTPLIICIPSVLRYWTREFDTQIKRHLFSLLAILFAILSYIFLNVEAAVRIWKIAIILYYVGLYIWIDLIEIPKYDTGLTDYDAVWFERTASNWGKKFVDKYFSNTSK